MMAADYITGLAVAAVFKRSNKSESGTLDSKAGFRGLVKKCAILLLVYIAVLLDAAVGTHYVRSAVVLFFIGNEGLSLLENVGLMGVEYPAFLRNTLQALRDNGDGGEHEQDR
jgi:toxin secretion/phage lysis holin